MQEKATWSASTATVVVVVVVPSRLDSSSFNSVLFNNVYCRYWLVSLFGDAEKPFGRDAQILQKKIYRVGEKIRFANLRCTFMLT
jgi:hypothetical protein